MTEDPHDGVPAHLLFARSFSNPVSVESLMASPTGEHLCVVGSDGSVRIVDARTGGDVFSSVGIRTAANTTIIESPLFASCASWSPDGKLLAIGYVDGKVSLCNPFAHEADTWWCAHDSPISSLAWEQNGLGVYAMCEEEFLLTYWTRSTSRDSSPMLNVDEVYLATLLSPSHLVAVVTSEHTLCVLSSETGEAQRGLEQEWSISALVSSPTGQQVLVLYDEHPSAMWDIGANHLLPFAPGPSASLTGVYAAAWSRDGSTLACARYDAVAVWRVSDLYAVDGAPQVIYPGHGLRAITWVEDGVLAYGGDNGIVVTAFS